MQSKVYLVGAGPGDPGLITVKGRQCIETADVIVYDYLAAEQLLVYRNPASECIYVGKKGGDHTLTQDKINQLIIDKALAGNVVTRLKGGDPFIFGRGGEEAEELVAAGIPFEIVPGVTSAIAAPAYAGIPLTHRAFTSNVAFVTGHEDPTKQGSSIDWSALAKGIGTVVFLMGVKNLPHISKQLMDHGRSPQTPVAVVRWGTTTRQQTVIAKLETAVEEVRKAGLKAPAIIVVGEVVTLRPQLKWFENRPLFGRRILVTRARAQASDLVRQLTDLGAVCWEHPTIDIAAYQNGQPLLEAIDQLTAYDWLVFTSVNGVSFFFDALATKGLDTRALGHLQTAVIGPATADRLRQYGVRADIMPDNYRAEAVVAAFADIDLQNKKVLLPRALEARPVLPQALRAQGAQVDEVPAYETSLAQNQQAHILDLLETGQIDLVTFTSSSTVSNFKRMLPTERFAELVAPLTVASIGPITTQTAEELGLAVHIEADTYTIPGLCDALLKHFQTHPAS